ncbi:MAG TPA: nuclear transport factor 2 family protein [Thermomicrobiales bacterium]|nr:nuclear transport factor 2 family protein [Thermomicrobiales bacterium]
MTIAETYYDGINRWDFARVASILADDVEFTGAMGVAHGKDACIDGLRGLRNSIERFEVVYVWDDGAGNIAVWFEIHVPGIDPVPGVNWMRVRDGKIFRTQAVFDPRAFIDAMRQQQG